MGRHSRRGPAPKDDSAAIAARLAEERDARSGDRRDPPGRLGGEGPAATPYPDGAVQGPGRPPRAPGAVGLPRAAFPGAAGFSDGTPARGVPRPADGTPAQGVPRFAVGGPARGVPGPGLPGATPARGVPRFPDGTPAHGMPRLPDGTPAHGVPRAADGASAQGAARGRGGGSVRGAHPEQREAGGGWGEVGGPPGGGAGPGVVLPRQRQAGPGGPGRRRGPRQDYLEAFEGAGDGTEDVDLFAPRPGRNPRTEERPAAGERQDSEAQASGAPAADGVVVPAQRGGKGRAFAGIAAAAVTTVLAVIVAGQVTGAQDGGTAEAQPATDTGQARDAREPGASSASASPETVTLTYDEKMGRKYPLGVALKGPGKFDAVPGSAKAPGKGQKYRYRVDIEQGLGLDGELFAEAVQKTLNDQRSWAHGGARTFERVSSGKPDFVITLASPGTTAEWCAKSDLDTAEENVSCDSAATERVMINAYRWAQGSKTYGDKIHAYRQMLINHEVGHRLGHGHVTCRKNGELAPVMQQQTKFLDHDGIHCLPNPWPYPRS
ncbi:DUF3152 domain-containing protein [Streptomyces sp. NPDC059688]|uniref:DUF3152 domain-containing protein n=1 Tax=Streptomyces sp. NPDC059688 TaxID=3346906 RepID=UPI0036A8BDE8